MTTYFVGFLAPLRAFDRFVPPAFTPIPPEQRHLTLVYLGDRVRVGELRERLELLPPLRPLTVTFKGLEAFPSRSRARYLAAVPTAEGVGALQRLRTEVLSALGAHRDRYSDFKPHVSIAFTRRAPAREARAFLPPLARPSPIRRAHGGATPHRLGPGTGPLSSAPGIIPASAGCARRAHGQRGGALSASPPTRSPALIRGFRVVRCRAFGGASPAARSSARGASASAGPAP